MTPRAPGVCLQPGCPNTPAPGRPRCPQHDTRVPWAGAGGKHHDWAWTKLRRHILRRDRYRCTDCGGHATEVDHLDRLADGGPLLAHPSRLHSVCQECHRKRELERNQQRRTDRS